MTQLIVAIFSSLKNKIEKKKVSFVFFLKIWFHGGEDKTWTPTLDPVHGPLSWTGSMDPLSWTGSTDAFYFDRKNTFLKNNEKWIKTEIVQK